MAKKIHNKSSTIDVLDKDYWLNSIYKKNCYKTTDAKYIKLFRSYKNSFILLKTKKKINKSHLVEKNLRFIGTNKTFQKKIELKEKYHKNKDISYKTNISEHEKKIVIDIAHKNFKFSRFHMDNRLSVQKSNLIKKKTVNNYFLGLRADKMYVQFYNKKLSGFCLLKYKNSDVARVDLICVDKRFSRKGLAGDMLKYSLDSLKKMNKKKLLVSTQEKNLSAIKLYTSLKFTQKSIQFIYHYIS